ncbi:MAG: phosphotransacetylase family protein [Chloroflexi bacterium]|nr:phosphotransacetylase family protein [Chloroflexota bacterium]
MVALYLTSLENGNGKTTVGAGLGKHWLDKGKKVGYFKPILADSKQPAARDADSDVAFIKQLFALKEPLDLISPVFSNESNLKTHIKEAYAKVSAGKDVVIIEGLAGSGQASRSIVEALDARVIIVAVYSKEPLKINDRDFGKNLLGIVWNKVPRNRLEQVRTQTALPILGILPEDRTLFAPTVGELAEHLHGEFLTGADKTDQLVENFMLGAHIVDHGPDYFGIKANKAVILRGERPDMQLAALETSTSCLVLTDNQAPTLHVRIRADEKKVPLILTRDSINTVAASVEGLPGTTRFNQPAKLPRLSQIMEQHFDFATVDKTLGLP